MINHTIGETSRLTKTFKIQRDLRRLIAEKLYSTYPIGFGTDIVILSGSGVSRNHLLTDFLKDIRQYGAAHYGNKLPGACPAAGV